jgi:1,4-alpha-glucan branching enzyme
MSAPATPPGLLRIPAPAASTVALSFAPLSARDTFDPPSWRTEATAASASAAGHFEIDIDALHLADGAYEYEFLVDDAPGSPGRRVPDPYAEELTRFGGYRGVFHVAAGKRLRRPFSWDDDLPPGVALPDNNALVIYEMPLRWVSAAPDDDDYRQVDLGTFDSALFERLDDLIALGINAIEFLPIQDSPDTLNWGYGTRFFLAPDLDMGSPVDLKFFIKQCHRRGIRVVLDVVMNHSSTKCPLLALAEDWFYLPPGSAEEGDRPDWGGRAFRYVRAAPDGHQPAREFHYRMAEFWVREYHADGFRIDEFKGINNWDFVQTFRERAWAEHERLFPGRPFLIIAEDSWRRAEVTQNLPTNPNGRQVADAIWNFAYRDEVRLLLRGGMTTQLGQPSRTDRVRWLVSGSAMWDDYGHATKRGFTDLAQAVNYVTSHDVGNEGEQRYLNDTFAQILRYLNLGDGSVANVRDCVDYLEDKSEAIHQAHADALDRVRSAFALLMTSVGIPMFLAGEEFGDVHDLDYANYRLKMSDPVDWRRRGRPGHGGLWESVRDLIGLRTSNAALQRDEVEFFHFHPNMDGNDGPWVFAYARTGGRPLGGRDQVVVVVNACGQRFPEYWLDWPWGETDRVRECAAPPASDRPQFPSNARRAALSLAPLQARVFTT